MDKEEKLKEFNGEITALQNKYGFRLVSRVGFPGGSVLVVPMTVEEFVPELPSMASPILE